MLRSLIIQFCHHCTCFIQTYSPVVFLSQMSFLCSSCAGDARDHLQFLMPAKTPVHSLSHSATLKKKKPKNTKKKAKNKNKKTKTIQGPLRIQPIFIYHTYPIRHSFPIPGAVKAWRLCWQGPDSNLICMMIAKGCYNVLPFKLHYNTDRFSSYISVRQHYNKHFILTTEGDKWV